MPRITTHEHFTKCLAAFLKQIAIDTGLTHPADQNMLQFVIGLGAGVGPTDYRTQQPLKMQFKAHLDSPMKTLIHVPEESFNQAQAQRIAGYFNHKHGAKIAVVVDAPYLKGTLQNIEILSGALVDEIDLAIEYQEIFRHSMLSGTKMFLQLPISEAARAELSSDQARVEIVPYPKGGVDKHRIEFKNISDAVQEEIMRIIQERYGSGSALYG